MNGFAETRKTGLSRLAVRTASAVLALFASLTAHADGTETLGPPSIAIAPGSGLVTAGFGLQSSGSDTDTLVVPVNADVNQVLLYWEGPAISNEQILLNGQLVIGQLIGGPSPFPLLNGRTYRADVTSLNLVQPGSNVLTVSTLLGIPGDLQGAGIVAIYGEATQVTYGGRAFGGQTRIGGNTTRVGDTGSLPPQGGDLSPAPGDNSLLLATARLKVLSSRALGAAGQTESTTSVSNFQTLVSAINLGADVIDSRAVARCTTTGPEVEGSSNFLGLRIGSTNQGVSFAPNRVLLNIPGVLRVVANEQTQSITSTTGRITVNALHISSPLLAFVLPVDIIVASTEAEVNCSGGVGSSFIDIRDGYDSAFALLANDFPAGAVTVPQTFTVPASPVARTAIVDLFVSGALAFDPPGDVARVEIRVDGNVVFNESELLNSVDGSFWDSPRIPIVIPPGATTVTVQIFSETENFVWVYASLQLAQEVGGNLYSGQATVLKANLKRFAVVAVADTGALPSSGGSLNASVNTLSELLGTSLITGTSAKATTVGAGEQSLANAAIQTLNLAALGLDVQATVVSSTAKATCDASNNASVTGSSQLVNLVIQGQPVTVAPNTVIPLPLGGSLILDERIVDQTAPNIASITVNAIRLVIPAQLEGYDDKDFLRITVAGTHADIVCQ